MAKAATSQDLGLDAEGRTTSYMDVMNVENNASPSASPDDVAITMTPLVGDSHSRQSAPDKRRSSWRSGGRRKKSHIAELETPQVSLAWRDLRYTIDVKQKVDGEKVTVTKTIVRDLTGGVSPGDMMCVMGTSGSGKTSFLNLLAGRYSVGTVTGSVLANGVKRDASYKRSIGYVEQDDLMFANLTVTEMLVYTALLRLPRNISHEDKLLRANEVLEQLGLQDCANTRIGSEGRRGISGGERKRTSIGIELITNPRVLFMDEPTSGLDAYTAVHVMRTVKALTSSGRSVICSIHQPRDKIYQLFDKLLLLAKGEAVYCGPSKTALHFFAEAGHPCPEHENLADWMLDTTTIDPRTPKLLEETTAVVRNMRETYEGSEYRKMALTWADDCSAATAPANGAVSQQTRRGWNLLWVEEFAILLSRAWKLVTREPRTTKAAVGQAIAMGVITGIVFFQLGDDQRGVRDRQGVLFFMTLGNAFPALQATLLLFHAEKRVFNRERMGGAYRVSSYFLSKSTTDLPIALAPMFLYISIVYFLVGLKATVDAFFLTMLMLMMVVACAQSFGMFISAATPSLQVAQAVGPLCMILLIMFGGFYLSIESIPVWLKWLEVFSFLQYGFVGMLRTQFKDENFSCDDPTYCLPTGQDVLDDMGVGGPENSYWAQFGKMWALIIFFRCSAYLALRFAFKSSLRFD
mmetsp:Transcript_34042/g.89367  ORF Transcript_34042/g.89367 Transcript_34042/m.89367 type:complete len:691 (-) Transcript_34042:156-2228(-)